MRGVPEVKAMGKTGKGTPQADPTTYQSKPCIHVDLFGPLATEGGGKKVCHGCHGQFYEIGRAGGIANQRDRNGSKSHCGHLGHEVLHASRDPDRQR